MAIHYQTADFSVVSYPDAETAQGQACLHVLEAGERLVARLFVDPAITTANDVLVKASAIADSSQAQKDEPEPEEPDWEAGADEVANLPTV